MTGPLVVLVVTVGVAALAMVVWVARAPLNPGTYVVRRSPERPHAVLPARLIPSPRALPGRPSAAGTARQIHVITDARERERGASDAQRA